MKGLTCENDFGKKNYFNYIITTLDVGSLKIKGFSKL